LGTALVGHKTQRLWGIERHEGGRLLLIATQACGELGRWDEALDWAKLATSYGGVADQSAVALAGLISDCRGDVAELSPNIADSWPATWPTMAAKWYCEWLAERHLVVKRPDAAGAVVRDALYHLAGKPENIFSGRLLVLGLRAAADLAVRATDTGDDTEAVAAADQATELETHRQRIDPDPFDPSRSPVPTAAADTAGWAAERSRLEGHSDPAAWAMAAQAWVDICRPYPAAYALWRQAEALVADRQARRNAAPILRSAYRAALDLGSGPLVIEVRDLAGRTNVSLETNPQVSEDDAASPAHLVKLTPRERDVTRLLADGLTNHAIARTPCHQP
jgi:hypothetical protein